MAEQRTYILCAGGTGGHLFPAQALASELMARGAKVHLVTDHRAKKYADDFPVKDIHMVQSATFSSNNPLKVMHTLWSLFKGVLQSGRIMKAIKPDAVIGFGGYPTIPPLIAATLKSIPSLIHEQNGVMGRANKLLAGRVNIIAGGFLTPDKSPFGDKTVLTGNPVRPNVMRAAQTPYQPPASNGAFHLLVFGGSQGAKFFGETVPQALALLPSETRARINLVLQARPEDVQQAQLMCNDIGVKADISPFFNNMAEHIANAHLVISRSGASTVSELAAIGRPALLVPYPYALDHDQAENAKAMVDKKGAEIRLQADLTKQTLADIIAARINDPKGLADMAINAKAAGTLDATKRLADLVQAMADPK